jgi:hypothetical protein
MMEDNDQLMILPDRYHMRILDDYIFIFEFDIFSISKKDLYPIIDSFVELSNYDNINYKLKKYINNLNFNKYFDPEEIFRLLSLYADWVHNNSINTKILRQPCLKDGFNGCLFLFYSMNTQIINKDNFNNEEYSNILMNILTFINITNRYKEECMKPDINEIIYSLNTI